MDAKDSLIRNNQQETLEDPVETATQDEGGAKGGAGEGAPGRNAPVEQAETRTDQNHTPDQEAGMTRAAGVLSTFAGRAVPAFSGSRVNGRDAGVCP